MRDDIVDFAGGVDINLDRQMILGGILKDTLTSEVCVRLTHALEAQYPLIEKIKRWQRLYAGHRKEQGFPYAGAANIAVPLTKWLVETVFVRVIDAIFSQTKLWSIRSSESGYDEFARELEDALEWWQKYKAKFREVIVPVLLQSAKMGTGVIKLNYVRQHRTVYRRASEPESLDTSIKKYKQKNGVLLRKIVQTEYEGALPIAVSREDFVISPEASCIKDAFIVGNRIYLRKNVFKTRCERGTYKLSEEERDRILLGDNYDTVKKDRATLSFKEINDYEQDIVELWEVWTRFDVDDDGEDDDIVLLIHPTTSIIVKGQYNPIAYGFRPYQDFVMNKVEYQFDGEGLCKSLEHIQEETDKIHNQRRNRLDQITGPVYLRRIDSVEGKLKLHPGAINDVDNIEDAVKELAFHDVYPSTEREEDRLIQYGMNVVGVSPHAMGVQTAERPVARDSMVLIQEMNKKFKMYIDNLRYGLTQFCFMLIEMFAQYQPEMAYNIEGEKGFESKTLEFPFEIMRDGLVVDLMASSEVMNSEVRREINMVLYQLQGDYLTKLAGIGQAITSPEVPIEFKKLIYESAKVGAVLMKRVVKDFGSKDADELVLEIDEAMDVQKAVQEAEQMRQMMIKQQQEAQRVEQMALQQKTKNV